MYIDDYEVLTKLSESLINIIQTLENSSSLNNLDIPSATRKKSFYRLNESESIVLENNPKRVYLIQARPSSIKQIVLAYPKKSFKQLLSESVVQRIAVDDLIILRLGEHISSNQNLLNEADDTDNPNIGEADINDAGTDTDTSPESMLGTDDTDTEDSEQTNEKITVEANTVYELRIIYQTLKLLQQTFNFIYRVGADETIIELNVLFQRVYQAFLDFLDKFEMYEEDERKKIIARLKQTTLQLARALLNYVEHEL